MRYCIARSAAVTRTRMPRAAVWRSPALRHVAMIALIVAPCITSAQDYPDRPIRMIATFDAGGGADAYARRLAAKLSEIFQQQVIVDNRGRANGIVGTETTAKAAPNGYTIMFVTSAHAINAVVRRDLPYDTLKDFAPISLFTTSRFFLLAHPSFAAQSVPELLALARSKPGQINYASTGPGSAMNFAGEMLKVYAKVDIVHIAYKAVPAALTDVLAGAVPLITFQGPTAMALAKAGKLRALAVTSATRSPVWPDVPTIQEGGVPKYIYTSWHALLAPHNTPKPVVARLNQAIMQAVHDRNMAKAFIADGVELRGTTPEELGDFLVGEIAKHQELVREMGGLQID